MPSDLPFPQSSSGKQQSNVEDHEEESASSFPSVSIRSRFVNVKKRARRCCDCFLVMDFEATCEDSVASSSLSREIIDFPCVLLESKTLEVVGEFREFVRPRFSMISDFCSQLTGISAEYVAQHGNDLSEVLLKFAMWLQGFGKIRVCAVTCGDWDLKVQLPAECLYKKLEVPACLRRWINIKKPFCSHYLGQKTGIGMMGMLRRLHIVPEGKHHDGLDDSRNTAKIVKALVEDGAELKVTDELPEATIEIILQSAQKSGSVAVDTSLSRISTPPVASATKTEDSSSFKINLGPQQADSF